MKYIIEFILCVCIVQLTACKGDKDNGDALIGTWYLSMQTAHDADGNYHHTWTADTLYFEFKVSFSESVCQQIYVGNPDPDLQVAYGLTYSSYILKGSLLKIYPENWTDISDNSYLWDPSDSTFSQHDFAFIILPLECIIEFSGDDSFNIKKILLSGASITETYKRISTNFTDLTGEFEKYGF
mgnify:CR=1 FL=1